MTDNAKVQAGILSWFTRNTVAANLLMLCIVGAGIYSAITIRKAAMPDIEIRAIEVSMPYRGAAPAEVEEGIVIKIEEALEDIQGIRKITSTANEGSANINIEVEQEYDVDLVLDEVKVKVDSINSFPAETENPIIRKVQFRRQTLWLQVSGDLPEAARKEFALDLKDQILHLEDVTTAEIYGIRPYEISIEVSESTLRRYNLTLGQVAQAIRDSSLDLPAGTIRSETGNILLRTKGQAYREQDFANIVLISRRDGTRLTLGDVAIVRDGFIEADFFAVFNGKPSIGIAIYSVGEQSALDISARVKDFVNTKSSQLPEGIRIDYWSDSTVYLQARLDMMLKNMAAGALLVFIVLALFLHIRLAFWVIIGLPVAFLGAIAMMPLPPAEISLNMMSLFGFILVLGIVVDDAIIIGESVYTRISSHGHSIDNVIIGAQRVATPATFGVLTTVVAFLPMVALTGAFAPMPQAVGWVVILCLIFSLVESKWILPAHLASMHYSDSNQGRLAKIQHAVNQWLQNIIQHHYKPLLAKAIEYRYTTVAIFLSCLILGAGLVGGGIVRMVFFPDMKSDFIRTNIEMVDGMPQEQTRKIFDTVNNALLDLNAETQQARNDGKGFLKNVFMLGRDGTNGFIFVELNDVEKNNFVVSDITQDWRERVGAVPGVKKISFVDRQHSGGGAPIAFQLVSNDADQLDAAAAELEQKLKSFNGVFDVQNGATSSVPELKLNIQTQAEVLGITLTNLATQVRQAFYGAEAQRMQRGKDEVKVMVRYPEIERKSVTSLEDMYIRAPNGEQVPFSSVATVELGQSYAQIKRINRERALTVSADAHTHLVEPGQVVKEIVDDYMPELQRRYPAVGYKLDGGASEEHSMLTDMLVGFIYAMFGIYALLAIPLRSYTQPLIIMGVIPFGAVGALVGHWLLDMPLSSLSIFGLIALAGVVVNDGIILVDFVNRAADEGMSKVQAAIESGAKRFRAIMLTSLTTFLGLLPICLETSLQAEFVKPMAVSLGFGILFATVITLILVPSLYVILDDVKKLLSRKSNAVSV